MEVISAPFVGAWANTYTEQFTGHRRKAAWTCIICNAIRDDFEIGNMSITHNLKDALDDLSTVGDCMVKILPSDR